MPDLNKIFNAIGGRKFLAVIISVVVFYTSVKFSGENLMWIIIAYMGANAIQKRFE